MNIKQVYRQVSRRRDVCVDNTVNMMKSQVDGLQSDLINYSSKAGKEKETCELERILQDGEY